jgi:hypothetical protein
MYAYEDPEGPASDALADDPDPYRQSSDCSDLYLAQRSNQVWAFVGAIPPVLEVGSYIRMNLT